MRWHIEKGLNPTTNPSVSIPKRVSDALAPKMSLLVLSISAFQSLRGFPMRWHSFSMRPVALLVVFQSLRGFPMRWHYVWCIQQLYSKRFNP